MFFIWVRHNLENKGNRKRKQTLFKGGKWGSVRSPDIHMGSPSGSLSPSIHSFHSSLTMKLLGRKGRLIQYCRYMKYFTDIRSRGSLKTFWSYSPATCSKAWYPTRRHKVGEGVFTPNSYLGAASFYSWTGKHTHFDKQSKTERRS